MTERLFQIGDRVTKTKGSSWTGRVVGLYSTQLTPFGYAVESENEPGSVQIYPEHALTGLDAASLLREQDELIQTLMNERSNIIETNRARSKDKDEQIARLESMLAAVTAEKNDTHEALDQVCDMVRKLLKGQESGE